MKSLIVFLLLISVRCYTQKAPPNQLILSRSTSKISFTWQADSINGKLDPYGSMLLPVKLPGCPREFYMQFDLGSPVSMFYSNKINAIKKQFPGATTSSFFIGDMKVQTRKIGMREMNDTGTVIIGTIGSDLIEDKMIMINYPEQYLLIGNTIPLDRKTTLSDFIFMERRVLFPVKVNGKGFLLYFDTGSSAFELLTDQKTVLSLAAPGAKPNSYPVKSWNNTLTVTSYLTNDSINIGSNKIPLVTTAYVEGASDSQVNQMLKLGIGGLTGNKLFLNYILVLDTKNEMYALLNKE